MQKQKFLKRDKKKGLWKKKDMYFFELLIILVACSFSIIKSMTFRKMKNFLI